MDERLRGPGRRASARWPSRSRRALYLYVVGAARAGEPRPGRDGRRRAAAHGEVPPGPARRRRPARRRVPPAVRPARSGAGRPAKLYRRADRQIAVTLPDAALRAGGARSSPPPSTRLTRHRRPGRVDAVREVPPRTPAAAPDGPPTCRLPDDVGALCWPGTATSRGSRAAGRAGELSVPRPRRATHRAGLRDEPAPAHGTAGRPERSMQAWLDPAPGRCCVTLALSG